MRPGLPRVLADAAALWRSERDLLLPLAGVFFFLPMLGMVLLIAHSGFGKDIAPEKLGEAMIAFQTANLLPVLLAGIVLDFGTFAVLNLFLQGRGATLGQVLGASVRRFLPYLAISFAARFASSFGLSLFVLPGLFLLARTWLAGVAYAAAPEKGPIAAFAEGWRRSRGVTWLVMLATALFVMVPALFASVVLSAMIAGVGMALGGGEAGMILGYLVTAAIGAFAWTWIAVLGVAFYRLTGASSGT
ncbi:MAG: hypothetical protein J7500_01260 [Sphingomonas sp.]|uniref:hypothetical protein n=1 Tax=Sphingomonas sp. TaxID=28214 RepID=UPI001B23E7BD|nr:hypothetical protein [Sphingomonas sp.]MBO9621316.1 hypothetical protein [Sphingomonas sp.]